MTHLSVGKRKFSSFQTLLFLEILLLLYSIFQYVIPLRSYHYQGKDLIGEYGRYQSLGGSGMGCYVDRDLIDAASVDPQYVYITTPPVDLPRGSYRVTVNYATDDSGQRYAFTAKYRTYPIVAGNDGNRLPMDAGRMDLHFSTPARAEGYEVHVNYSGSGYLFVESITVQETNAGKNILLFYVILFSLLADGIFLYYNRIPQEYRRRARVCIAAVIGLTVFSCMPLLTYYQPQGDDLLFHLNRIEAVKESLQAGRFPNRVSLYWNKGYGYAAGIFYGEAFLYVPALLRILGFTVQDAYKFYVVVVSLSTLLAAYFCFYKVFRHNTGALFGAAAYLLSPYRLVCVYQRAAVGEYTALVFYPLVFYGLYCIYKREDGNADSPGSGWMPLLLGYSGLIHCHVISCLIAAMFIGLFCLVFIKRMLCPARLLLLLKAGAGTVLLNLWFLLPFADYMHLGYAATPDSVDTLGRMNAQGAFLGQMLTVFQRGIAQVYTVMEGLDHTDERNYALGCFGLVAFVYIGYRLYQGKGRSELSRIGDFSLAFGAVAAFMCTIWFPWDAIQQMNGLTRMITKNIQFPWRFLGIACFFFSVTAVCLAALLEKTAERYLYCGILIFLVGVSGLSADNYMYDFTQNVPLLRYVNGEDLDSCGMGGAEYLPEDTPAEFAESTETLAGGRIEILEERREKDGHAVTCSNAGEEDSWLDFPLIPYRGYVCRDQESGGKLEVRLDVPGRVRVVVPAGYRGTCLVRFEEPWQWRMAEVISLLTAAVLVAGAVWGRRKKAGEGIS